MMVDWCITRKWAGQASLIWCYNWCFWCSGVVSVVKVIEKKLSNLLCQFPASFVPCILSLFVRVFARYFVLVVYIRCFLVVKFFVKLVYDMGTVRHIV